MALVEMVVQAVVALEAVREVLVILHPLHHHKEIMLAHPQTKVRLVVVVLVLLEAMAVHPQAVMAVLVRHQVLLVLALPMLAVVAVVFTQVAQQELAGQVAVEMVAHQTETMVLLAQPTRVAVVVAHLEAVQHSVAVVMVALAL
tara:strand:+ start:119 stop:550 length:432 start_codon:yes stop_codon:yes gene_type:complete